MISSQARTLEDLFPGYNGVLPLVKQFRFEHQIPNFETFDGKQMIRIPEQLLRRDHIIFGWDKRCCIHDLSRLFKRHDVFIVFDTNVNQWLTIPRDLSRKLGVDSFIDFVIARDEVAAKYLSTSKDPVYREAHIRACSQANEQVHNLELDLELLLNLRRTERNEALDKIKKEYIDAYNRAFMLYIHQHGEYKIKGYKKKHI